MSIKTQNRDRVIHSIAAMIMIGSHHQLLAMTKMVFEKSI